MKVGHQVLAVKNANYVVQDALVDREAGVARALDHKQNLFKRRTDLDCRRFDAGHHDVFHLAFRKFKNTLEHSAVFVAVTVDESAKLRIRHGRGQCRRIIANTTEEEGSQADAVLRYRIKQPHANLNRQHDSKTDPFRISRCESLWTQLT